MPCRRRKMSVTSPALTEGTALSGFALYGQWSNELTLDKWAAASPARPDLPCAAKDLPTDNHPPERAAGRRGLTGNSLRWIERNGDITPEFSGRAPHLRRMDAYPQSYLDSRARALYPSRPLQRVVSRHQNRSCILSFHVNELSTHPLGPL
jgi:hypothetical protein